jgi:FMN phosphatase YigB (HAD superfamily)
MFANFHIYGMGATKPSLAAAQWPISFLPSLSSLPDGYRACLLDQFGVLHDGVKPYPGAVEAVQHLKGRGLELLIISNSSRRELTFRRSTEAKSNLPLASVHAPLPITRSSGMQTLEA